MLIRALINMLIIQNSGGLFELSRVVGCIIYRGGENVPGLDSNLYMYQSSVRLTAPKLNQSVAYKYYRSIFQRSHLLFNC